MDILMPLYKHWSDMILSGKKPLEFRSKIGNDFKPNRTIYLYESSRFGGCKKVVGEVKIKNIIKIPETKYPVTPFIGYYYKNIEHNDDILNNIQNMYALFERHGKKVEEEIFMLHICNSLVVEEYLNTGVYPETIATHNCRKLSADAVQKVQNYLFDIGYINGEGLTNYKYAIEVCNPKRYETPIDLSNFTCNGKVIEHAPQSWCYCERKII